MPLNFTGLLKIITIFSVFKVLMKISTVYPQILINNYSLDYIKFKLSTIHLKYN